jgi:hypothetical protein
MPDDRARYHVAGLGERPSQTAAAIRAATMTALPRSRPGP